MLDVIYFTAVASFLVCLFLDLYLTAGIIWLVSRLLKFAVSDYATAYRVSKKPSVIFSLAYLSVSFLILSYGPDDLSSALTLFLGWLAMLYAIKFLVILAVMRKTYKERFRRIFGAFLVIVYLAVSSWIYIFILFTIITLYLDCVIGFFEYFAGLYYFSWIAIPLVILILSLSDSVILHVSSRLLRFRKRGLRMAFKAVSRSYSALLIASVIASISYLILGSTYLMILLILAGYLSRTYLLAREMNATYSEGAGKRALAFSAVCAVGTFPGICLSFTFLMVLGLLITLVTGYSVDMELDMAL